MNYIDITSPDINNGLGCRVTLWISGCPFHCKGCQNPESWDNHFGKPFELNSVFKQIEEELKKPYISGLTLCGGEPLWGKTSKDLGQLVVLLKSLKKEFPTKNVWVYSGATYEELTDIQLTTNFSYYKEILDICDVLVDGQYIEAQRDIRLPFRGSTNQRVIDLNETRKYKKVIELYIE